MDSLINLLSIIAGIFGIGFLIGFHELGHFLAAKAFGVRTPSFSIGFGPRIFSKKIGETQFTLSAIPMGGYVEMAGSQEVGQGEQADAHAIDQGSLAVKPYWQKMVIMIAGIVFNLLFAYGALIALSFSGFTSSVYLYPFNASTTVGHVNSESPAQQAGILPKDVITAINNKPVTTAHEIIQTIVASPSTNLDITVVRNGSIEHIIAPVGERTVLGGKEGFLGLEFERSLSHTRSFKDAVTTGIYIVNNFVYKTAQAFKNIITARNTQSLSGPLMIIHQTAQDARKGWKDYLILLAIISINLAVLNLIPLPIFDGGQMLIYSLEALTRRSLSDTMRFGISIATWILVLGLFAYLSIKDINALAGTYIKKMCAFIGWN